MLLKKHSNPSRISFTHKKKFEDLADEEKKVFENLYYPDQIAVLAKHSIDKIFFNSNEQHALIVLKNIILNATNSVKTICGNMCSEISNDREYLEIVDNYLKFDSKRIFKILFDSYDENFKNKEIAEIFSKYPNQVEIKKLKKDFEHIDYEGNPVHLTVADKKSFRLEINIETKIAWGNFFDTGKGEEFDKKFDYFFEDSEVSEIIN